MDFQLQDCIEFIQSGSYQNVALQFHTSVVSEALLVEAEIKSAFPSIRFFVIADSPFPSCCTDVISAKHIPADAILHFGHACTTRSPIPVLHIPGRFTINPERFAASLSDLPTRLSLQLSPSVSHQRDEVILLLETSGRSVVSQSDAEAHLFIGKEFIASSVITSADKEIFIYNLEEMKTTKPYEFIAQRYHYISKVKESSVFGIVVLSIEVYNGIIKRLEEVLKRFDKDFYVIYCGKITPSKLGNFPEIDMFVQVSCPYTQLPDNRIFYKPIITPFELESGFSDNWSGEYNANVLVLNDRELPEGEKTDERVTLYDRWRHREWTGLKVEESEIRSAEEGIQGNTYGYAHEHLQY